MRRLSALSLLFGILFGVMLVTPGLLSRSPFAPYPLMTQGDVFDLLTPFVLIPLYWMLFELVPGAKIPRRATLLFLLAAVAWVQGQGMHLAANAIGHLLEDATSTNAYALTHFIDEGLSHYIWHIGLIGLSALLIVRQWRHPFDQDESGLWMALLGGLIYGAVFFIAIIESVTWPMAGPFALLVVLFILIRGRGQLRRQPLLLFSLAGYALALVLLVGWGLY